MNYWESVFGSNIKPHEYVTLTNEMDKVIAFEKGELVYIFNFHPSNSYSDYQIGTHWRSDHMLLFETDEERFGGHQRLNAAHDQWVKVKEQGANNRRYSFQIYIPSRCAIVLAPFEFACKYKEVKMPAFDPKDPTFQMYMGMMEQQKKQTSQKTEV